MAEQDLLDRTRQELRVRLKELEPLVREHERLRSALAALESKSPRRGAGASPDAFRGRGGSRRSERAVVSAAGKSFGWWARNRDYARPRQRAELAFSRVNSTRS